MLNRYSGRGREISTVSSLCGNGNNTRLDSRNIAFFIYRCYICVRRSPFHHIISIGRSQHRFQFARSAFIHREIFYGNGCSHRLHLHIHRNQCVEASCLFDGYGCRTSLFCLYQAIITYSGNILVVRFPNQSRVCHILWRISCHHLFGHANGQLEVLVAIQLQVFNHLRLGELTAQVMVLTTRCRQQQACEG